MNVNIFANQKILVTGGAGHIGSHLIESLLNSNPKKIVSIDDYSNGSTANEHQGCTYIKACTSSIFDVLENERFDYIFHFGEFARVEQSFQNVDQLIQSNIVGTAKVHDYFIKNKCGKLIYSCSSAIYSINEPSLVNSPYSIFKKCNRDLLLTLKEVNKSNIAILYFSNVYGGNEKATGVNATVVAKFLNAKKNKETVVVNGSGVQKRNFTFIDDVIEGVRIVAEKGLGDGYIIASKEQTSILELADMIGVEFVHGPDTLGNRQQSKISHSKMMALGWESKKTLLQYIRWKLDNG